MDYVYICRTGPNEELKYSLRSIEKNMPAAKVWLIGNRPIWYVGNLIHVKDVGGKFDNIRNCISIASTHKEISENFILMNDDFFVLDKIQSVPILHGGPLLNKITHYKESRMPHKYIKLLELTYNQLIQYGIKNPIDYDIHVPMIMNKKQLNMSLDIAYFPRSAYGNFANVGGQQIKDVKIYSNTNNMTDNTMYVSTEDKSFLSLKNKMLKNMFDEPSKYENPFYSEVDSYATV